MLSYREATLADGKEVLAKLRKEQRMTIAKLDLDALQLLMKVINNRFPSTTLLIDGEPAAVFGLSQESLLADTKIWMITSPLIETHPVSFLRASRFFTNKYYNMYGPLLGVVDSDFEKSRRWLRWIGFKEISVGDFIVMRYAGGH